MTLKRVVDSQENREDDDDVGVTFELKANILPRLLGRMKSETLAAAWCK